MARQEETADRRFGMTLPRLAVLALLLSAARFRRGAAGHGLAGWPAAIEDQDGQLPSRIR